MVEPREVRSVELDAKRGTLKLRALDPSWVRLVLLQDGVERELGAETLKYILDHVRAFLKHPSAQLKWVLTLSETHVTVYGSLVTEGVLLKFQDKDAKFFAELQVSEAERE